ncbi:unnamed protein product, partial [Mesorhabditis belari]|uniref:Histone H2B n=1 Tax=Mesorhabditis belari TaxID=2138241 RepID=A0AAF3FFX1_9BILA
MNALIVDTLDKLASEIVRLREAAKKKKKMVTAVDMQAAVRLVFPEGFARHAIIEGAKALEKYRRSLKS